MEGAGSSVEIESSVLAQTPEVNGVQNPIGEIVFLDLKRGADGTGRVDSKNIGTVLAQLRKEVEGGINLDQKGIKVHSSVAELLPQELSQSLETNVVCHNEPIPREEDPLLGKAEYFRDEKLGKIFDGDAYEGVLALHKKVYGERADVKLVRYNGTLVTVTEQRVGDNLRIIQVLDCDLPETAAYKEFRRKVREENLAPTSWPFGERKKENYIQSRHLIIEDVRSGKALDIRELLPGDWSLRYDPTTHLTYAQDSDIKYLQYAEITQPELLVGLLHEYGHCITDANHPDFYKEVKQLWEQVKWTTGGTKALAPETVTRTAELVARNERGASARAIQVIRILREQGFDIGISIDKISKLVNEALASHSRIYPDAAKFLKAA